MWYLGGKKWQAKKIVEAVQLLCPDFKVYIEPFCGAMWSAVAMIKAFPDRKFILSDVNPWLMRFWTAAANDGLRPPTSGSESLYKKYKAEMSISDPLTGYVGFAWSFAGTFFGTPARDKRKRDFGS